MKFFNWIKNKIPLPTEAKREQRQEQLRQELSTSSSSSSEIRVAQLELCTSLRGDIPEDPSQIDLELYFQWLFVMMPNRFAAACYVGLPVMAFFTIVFLTIVLGIKFFVLILPWFAMAAYFLFCASLVTLVLSGIFTLLFICLFKKES